MESEVKYGEGINNGEENESWYRNYLERRWGGIEYKEQNAS